MLNHVAILSLSALFCSAQIVPRTQMTRRIAAAQDDTDLLHPHIITIERLENLLRRAGEIFRPVADSTPEATQSIAQPQQYMQPPAEQPYNFYLPLFDYEDTTVTKLDQKSRKLEKFMPPPVTQHRYNYYSAKPKKSPKKFNAAEKQLNVKWLNTYEKANGGELPKAMYREQDERNRINFDDSFFAVDMQVKIPDNQPHNEPQHTSELLQHGEELAEEDLMAAPAMLVPQFSINYSATKRM